MKSFNEVVKTSLDKFFIFVDLDDVVFDTKNKIRDIIYRRWRYTVRHDQYMTNENTNGYLSKVLDDPKEFMVNPDLSNVLFDSGLDRLFSQLQHEVCIGYLTHRGYTPNAGDWTIEGLNIFAMDVAPYQFLELVNPSTYPSKYDYIEQILGVRNYLIVDDNPNSLKPIEEDRLAKTIIVDKPWNRSYENSFHRLIEGDEKNYLELNAKFNSLIKTGVISV